MFITHLLTVFQTVNSSFDRLQCLTTQIKLGAANRVRTGDIHVGNVMLYQLSYSRINSIYKWSGHQELNLD